MAFARPSPPPTTTANLDDEGVHVVLLDIGRLASRPSDSPRPFGPAACGRKDLDGLRRLAEDQAEGVADRVGENPEAGFPLGRKPTGAERQNRPFGGIDVVDPDVEV
jgi:hypothetical protein